MESNKVIVAAITELEAVRVSTLELLAARDVVTDAVLKVVHVTDAETVPVRESTSVLAGDDEELDDSDFTDCALMNEDNVAAFEAVTGIVFREDAEPL